MNEMVKKFIVGIPISNNEIDYEVAPSIIIKQTFAKQSSLSQRNGKLYGCFNADFSAACTETKITSIELSAIDFTQYAGDCSADISIDIFTYH